MKDVPGVVHLLRMNVEDDDRAFSSGGDGAGGRLVEREMHVGACAPYEAVAADRIQEPIHGAVEERRWRLDRREAEVHRHGMTLVRADAETVGREREALLVARRDDLLEVVRVDVETVRTETREDTLDVREARAVEREGEGARIVP